MDPLVTVLMLTYNHENYINSAIDSVLRQKTGFAFELLICDDCSTDGTRKTCIEYRDKFPGLIRLRLIDKNISYQRNYLENFKQAKGKYIAYLEGDDYWIDTDKLQKQFDFLESGLDIVLCYTNSYTFIDGQEEKKEITLKTKPGKNVFDLDYYLKNGCFLIPHLTLFVRKDAYPDPAPEWLKETFSFDWTIILLYMQKGKAAYIDDITSMYRIHQGGVTSSTFTPKIIHNGIFAARNLDKHFCFKYHGVFGRNHWRYRQLTVYYFENKKYLKALYWFFYCFMRNPALTIMNGYFLKTLYKVTFTAHEV